MNLFYPNNVISDSIFLGERQIFYTTYEKKGIGRMFLRLGTKGNNSGSDNRFLCAVIGLVFLLGISIIMILYLVETAGTTPSPTNLTFIIVFGVTALLSSLVIASLVLNVLHLSNKDESLGLPSGSVRAIIALSLILIFAILSIFMFQYLANPQTTVTITDITFNNSTTGNSTFTNTTTTTRGASEAMVDFSKQTLTTLSTLVVALAAFYFGTRSVQVAKGAEEIPNLFIDPSGETEGKKGEPLTIVVKPTPEDEAVTWKISEKDEYKSVVQESPHRFIYTPTVDKGTVTLTFKMPKYPDVSPKELKVNIS
jgi:hypothetical protein